MNGLAGDVRLAIWRIRLQPLPAATIVLTIGLAVGASTAIFSVVDGVLLEPLPFPRSDRLVRMAEETPTDRLRGASLPAIDVWSRDLAALEALTFFEDRTALVVVNGESDRLRGAMVSRNFADVLRVAPAAGRTFANGPLFGGPAEVLISHRLWQRLGTRPDVIGRSLSVDPRTYTIVGVMPAGFDFPGEADWWTTLPADMEGIRTLRDARFLGVIGRLRPEATIAGLQAEMAALSSRHPAHDKSGPVSMTAIGLHDFIVGQARWGIRIVAAAAGLLLVIACCNIAALLLARVIARQHESAVQVALGASRARLVRQSAIEVVLLAAAGGGLGVAAAVSCHQVIVGLSLNEVPRITQTAPDLRALAFALVVTIGSAVLVLLLPAWTISRGRAADGLRAGRGERTGPAVLPLLRALVVAEVALTFVLAASAGLLARTFDRLSTVDPGFSHRSVVAGRIHVPIEPPRSRDAQVSFYRDVIDRVAALPGVESAALGARMPLADALPAATLAVVGSPAPPVRAALQQVSPGYFTTIGARLVEGREIEPGDTPARPVVVLNEVLARRLFADRPAIGREVRIQFMTLMTATVVGISAPVRTNGLVSEPLPEAYVDYRVRPMPLTLFVRAGGVPESLMPAIRAAVRDSDPSRRATLGELTTLEREVARRLARPRFHLALVGTFGVVALTLTAAGLYGLLAFVVAQRRHELGVRLALGANPRDLFRYVAGHGAILTGLGMLLGAAAALATSRVMESLLFGITARDPVTLAATVGFVFAVAMLATWLPARRAQRTDPLDVLRVS